MFKTFCLNCDIKGNENPPDCWCKCGACKNGNVTSACPSCRGKGHGWFFACKMCRAQGVVYGKCQQCYGTGRDPKCPRHTLSADRKCKQCSGTHSLDLDIVLPQLVQVRNFFESRDADSPFPIPPGAFTALSYSQLKAAVTTLCSGVRIVKTDSISFRGKHGSYSVHRVGPKQFVIIGYTDTLVLDMGTLYAKRV